MDRYNCIKGLFIPLVDGDGFDTGEWMTVKPNNKIWVKPEDEDYRFVGGEVRLEDINDCCDWIEITKETFKECFKLVDVMERDI